MRLGPGPLLTLVMHTAIEVDDDGAVYRPHHDKPAVLSLVTSSGSPQIFVSVHTVGWFDLVEGRWSSSGRVGGGEDLLSGADLNCPASGVRCARIS
jgi:hypothetical protein